MPHESFPILSFICDSVHWMKMGEKKKYSYLSSFECNVYSLFYIIFSTFIDLFPWLGYMSEKSFWETWWYAHTNVSFFLPRWQTSIPLLLHLTVYIAKPLLPLLPSPTPKPVTDNSLKYRWQTVMRRVSILIMIRNIHIHIVAQVTFFFSLLRMMTLLAVVFQNFHLLIRPLGSRGHL